MTIPAITLVSLFKSAHAGEHVLPLGCLWLRAACEARGMGAEIRDLQFLPGAAFEDPDAIALELGETEDVVGISCMADLLPLAVAVARRLKEARPERIVILGGWGPSTVARRLIEAFPWIDVVARGEGEETLPELLTALAAGGGQALASVRGIATRIDGVVVENRSRPPVADVAGLPEPRLDDLDLTRYSHYTTVTARGCPYQCRFCEIPTLEERRVRARSVDAVADELEGVYERYGIDFVGFQDDIFLLSKKRVDAILDRLARRGVPMTWSGFARANAIDADWVARLAGQGCQQITFGIEAGADTLLSQMTKALTVKKAFTGIARALEHVSVRTFFLWGFPFETLTDFLGTVHAFYYAEYLGVAVQIGHVVPLSGSPLYLEWNGPLELHRSYPFGRIIQPPRCEELWQLVVDHPRIFPAFYAFPTADRDRKWEVAPGLITHTLG